MGELKLLEKMVNILQEKEVPIDDLLNKIEVDKLTIEQLISLYYGLYVKIRERITSE